MCYLIDYIVTTGATLEACAMELLRAEETKVSIATLVYTSA
jgi:competence protein ComFC